MDLVIILPVLVVSALLAARGSVRGRLVLAWYLDRMTPAGKAA